MVQPQSKSTAAQVYKDLGGNRLNNGAKGVVQEYDGSQHLTQKGVGALDAAATAGNVVENIGSLHHTTITLNGQTVAMTDQTTAGNQGHLAVYDFPAGNILVLGAEAALALVASGTPGLATNAAVVASLGTAAAGTGDATLTSTEANIVASTVSTLTTYAGNFLGRSTTLEALNATTNGGTATNVYLNLAVPDAGSSGNDVVTVTGTINLIWINLGNS